jgi:hypothetical protein
MAISRFVITAPVTIPAAAATAITGGFGTVSWANATNPTWWVDGVGPGTVADAYANQSVVTFVPGQVIYASSAGSGDGAAYALYLAIGSGNLRAYVQGQDDVGHAALGN